MSLPKPLLLLLGYLFVLAVLLCAFSLFGVRRIMDYSQPEHDQEIAVYAGHPVSQIIRPRHPHTNVINLFLKNVALRNQSAFALTVSRDSTILRRIDINGANIGDGENVRFQFSPLTDYYPGIEYVVTLHAESTPLHNAVGVGYSAQKDSLAYELYYSPAGKWSLISGLSQQIVGSLSLRLLFSWGILGLLIYYPLSRLKL